MASIQIPSIYDEFIDYLVEKATPEEILAFKVSDQANERAEYLLDKNNAGLLTPEEEVELQQMLYFEDRVSMLKARAALQRSQQ